MDKRGLSLIEMMLSVAVIVVLAGASVPVSSYFQNKTNVDSERNVIVKTLRRAQALSQDMIYDASWGVRINSGQVILFRGSSYASRVVASDEATDFPTSIVTSGVNEVVFSKIWGEPNISGTITLTGPNNEVDQIQINSKGMVNY
jgi:prepilin-type N-terminal cleavage/methylation domain-containing protein